MAKIDVFNLKREKVGDLDLADEVFATEIKEHMFQEVVVAQLASRRAGTKAAKERSAVSGSSKKISKQTGTGQARHGPAPPPLSAGAVLRRLCRPSPAEAARFLLSPAAPGAHRRSAQRADP